MAGWYLVSYSTSSGGKSLSLGHIDVRFELGPPVDLARVVELAAAIADKLRGGAGVLPPGAEVLVLGWSFMRPLAGESE